MHKEFLAAVAIVLTFAMFVPYIRSIHQGRTKPHVFSWIIWSLGTVVVFFAQLAGRGGSGAWPIGVSGTVAAYIAVLAYRKLRSIYHEDRLGISGGRAGRLTVLVPDVQPAVGGCAAYRSGSRWIRSDVSFRV